MAATKKYTTAQVDAFEARSHALRLAKLKSQKSGTTPPDARANLIAKRLKHSKSKSKGK